MLIPESLLPRQVRPDEPLDVAYQDVNEIRDAYGRGRFDARVRAAMSSCARLLPVGEGRYVLDVPDMEDTADWSKEMRRALTTVQIEMEDVLDDEWFVWTAVLRCYGLVGTVGDEDREDARKETENDD